MAIEGVELNAMSGGNTVAVDRIDSKDFQLLKLVTGDDGTNGGMVTDANPYPTKIISIAAGDNNIGNVDIASSALPTGAATEATLAALNGKVTAVDTGAVVVSSSALPTGAATSAKQDTAQTALDAIKTATELIDNAISGSEMQVDIVTMPNVTIANASLPVTDNAGSLTVDAPVGTPVFVRLSDGTSAITTLPVSLASVPSHAVTNAGTFATQVTSIAAGDNNIGNVDVVTLPALPAGTNNIGDVDILSIAAGDNNIGNVDVVTLPALPAGTNNIGDVDVLTQPARSRTVDAISVAQQTDALMNGLTALTPKFANISAAASGDNTLVTAVASKKIRVLSLFMMATGTVNAYIRDDAGTPVNLIGDATNKLTLVSGSGFVLPHNPLGWTETTSGEGLQLNLSAAIGVAGCLTYVEV